YFSRMVPIIHQNHGVVNKFMGDGIIFFFGAPRDNPQHAQDATNSVMQMQSALELFNQRLAQENLPNLRMRAGITTGTEIVGDAGPVGRSDYTVLGDSMNLSARLESANKVTGTQILISQETA